MESADRESRRLDILSVKKEANLSAREVGEVEVGKGGLMWSRCRAYSSGVDSFGRSMSLIGHIHSIILTVNKKKPTENAVLCYLFFKRSPVQYNHHNHRLLTMGIFVVGIFQDVFILM